MSGFTVADLEPKAVEWAWEGYAPRGGITLVVGPKGLGKSTLAAWIAARASRGDEAFGGKPLRVFADSVEDDPEVVLRPRIEVAGGELPLIETLPPTKPAWRLAGDYKTHRGLEELLLRGVREGHPFDLIVLDSLSGFVPRLRTPDVAAAAFERLTRQCRDHDCALLFIHHLRKTAGGSLDAAIAGAGDLTRLARAVFMFGNEAAGHDEDDERGLVLAPVKFNLVCRSRRV